MDINKLALDTSEKIAKMLGKERFGKEALEIKEVLLEIFPSIIGEVDEHVEEVSDVIDGLRCLTRDLEEFKSGLEKGI